ncbi:hypothetical protein SKA58_08090 [Sphingomonas sp. SKA58]|jgi:hypothetical protein|nr:hypothetical protein SKA58_08090 [Sphingomonas sp. SKA58]
MADAFHFKSRGFRLAFRQYSHQDRFLNEQL